MSTLLWAIHRRTCRGWWRLAVWESNWWHKGDDPRECVILGMLVACSLFVAFGWIDRGHMRGDPLHPRSPPPAGSTSVPPVE